MRSEVTLRGWRWLLNNGFGFIPREGGVYTFLQGILWEHPLLRVGSPCVSWQAPFLGGWRYFPTVFCHQEGTEEGRG